MTVLYLYLDHGGDLRFIPQSNAYFTLASLATWEPPPFAAAYHQLKHELIQADPAGDWNHHRFHASEDPIWVKVKFLELIASRSEFRVDAVTVRKTKIFKSYQPVHVFYPHMTELLLKYVMPKVLADGTPDRIEYIFDHFSLKGLSPETFFRKMEVSLARVSQGIPFRMRFHYSHAHPHLQAVDYCAWAIGRRYERGDFEAKKMLARVILSDWEYATRTSHRTY